MIPTSRRLAEGREIIYFDVDGSGDTHDVPDVRELPRESNLSQPRLKRGGSGERVGRAGKPLSVLRPGHGRCEVVCFTSDHSCRFADLGQERTRLIVERVGAPDARTVGAARRGAGLRLREPRRRSASPSPTRTVRSMPIPSSHPRVARVLEQVARHRQATGGDLFAEVLDAEASGPRAVTADEHWVAFVPAAARWPYEVQLFPRRRVPDLAALSDDERESLARVYVDLLGRFAHLFDTPSNYIASWAQAPVGEGRADWWLHLQLFSLRRAVDKLKYLAGSESGMGIFISDTNPEATAEQLRGVRRVCR